MTHKNKMVKIANQLNKLGVKLSHLAYEIEKDNLNKLSDAETDKFICQEASNMVKSVCKHLTSNGTRF